MLLIFLRIDFSSRLPEIGIFLHDSPSYTHYYKFHLHIDLHILQFSLLYIHFYLTPSSIQCIFTFGFSIQTPSYSYTFYINHLHTNIFLYISYLNILLSDRTLSTHCFRLYIYISVLIRQDNPQEDWLHCFWY